MSESDNLIQLDFSEEMKNSYRNYALSVIISRALPDVRDGLKPVQRRILYAMTELGLDPKKPHRKSARIVGDTMGKYHPHGDSSIYDALVHMSEDYSLSIPLIDGHGNFGSIDGDGHAAMRYTEARLSEGAMTMLEHLEKGLVDFVPNFDESEKEPVVLPAMLPNLLINGTTGIAVGMATNIPPHNPVEVIDAVIAYMDNKDITLDELMTYIPGPDFPTGGTVINASDIRAIYETGEGKLKIRALAELESGDSGRTNIVFTEIPYTVAGNKSKLVESLVDLMRDKVFEEIYDVRDESSKEGIRIVVEVKKDRDTANLLNGLYKKTLLEDTYSVNLLAVKDNQPYTFNLKSLIHEFVDFQKVIYTKEYTYLLDKASDRLEIVNGLIKATDLIDLIIEILRGSTSVKQAKACLTSGDTTDIKFKSSSSEKSASSLSFSERQADAILSMQLSKLIGLELQKLIDEKGMLEKNIEDYKKILSEEKALLNTIKKQLREFRKKFDIPRRTMLTDIQNIEYVVEEKIEDVYMLIDKFGYIKCIDDAAYQRSGEDIQKDYVNIIQMKNTDKLCVFTAEGNMYQIKASTIPKCKLKDKGILVHNLCKVGKENILTYCSYDTLLFSSVLFTTKTGFIKIVPGAEFETNRSMIQASKLKDDDLLIGVEYVNTYEHDQSVALITHNNIGLRFSLDEVDVLKKTSIGLRAISLKEGDYVVQAKIITADTDSVSYRNNSYPVRKFIVSSRNSSGKKF